MGKRETIAVALLVSATAIWAQPQASFTVVPAQMCATMKLNITNLTPTGRLSYAWDFGPDASTRYAAGATAPGTISYLYAGTYRVRLTIFDSASGHTSSDTVLVTVWPFPYFTNALPAITPMQCGDSVRLTMNTNVPARIIWTVPALPGALPDTANHIMAYHAGLYIPRIYMDTTGCVAILDFSAGTTVTSMKARLDTTVTAHHSIMKDTVIINNIVTASNDTVIISNGMVVSRFARDIILYEVDSIYKTDSVLLILNQCGTVISNPIFKDSAMYITASYSDTTVKIVVDTIIQTRLSVTTDSTISVPGGGSMFGTLTGTGGAAITTIGFEIGLTTSYGITTVSTLPDTGGFSSVWGDMPCGQTYHFRAYATNVTGTVRGIDRVFYTDSCAVSHNTNTTNVPLQASTQTDIIIYPNPFTESVSIEMTGSFISTVYTLTGQKIAAQDGKDVLTMHVSEVPPGIYVAVIQKPDGTMVQRKMVKE